MTYANDGTMIQRTGNMITTSQGETYILDGKLLVGPGGMVSMNVSSIAEAEGIVIGLHGGKRF